MESQIIPSPVTWSGPYVSIDNTGLDVASLLQETLAHQFTDLSDLSPLSSIHSSPSPTPPRPTAELPHYSAVDDLMDLSDLSDISDMSDIPSFERVPAPPAPGPPTQQPPLTSKARRKLAKKAQSRRNRKKKEEQRRAAELSVPARSKALNKHAKLDRPITAAVVLKDGSKPTKSGYIGRRTGFESGRTHRLEELVGPGSNTDPSPRTSKPVLDGDGVVVAFLPGRPDDVDWDSSMQTAAGMLDEARASCYVADPSPHRRGHFPALQCGISYGGGQTTPANLSNNSTNQQVLDRLTGSRVFQRLAGFASSVLATRAPRLHQHYQATMAQLSAKHPHLKKPFTNSIFAAATFNLGPRTVCFPHVDLANLAFGWCAVVALGDFNHRKGGHLVLWNCGLVIEFPPGSTILFPSAILAHSNTEIQAYEKRFSFTQYSAGGLFRWVEQDFMTLDNYLESLNKEGLEAYHRGGETRWVDGLSLLPQLKPLSQVS